MTKREEYESRAEALVLPILDAQAFELVDVEYVREAGNWFLRFYIDKEGGITIDDCELVSRALSDKLDEEDFIPEAYVLEVSSPGLGRQLKKEKDYERSIGEEVDIRLYRAVDRRKEFTGILTGYSKESFTIEEEDGTSITLPRDNVAIIKLALDF